MRVILMLFLVLPALLWAQPEEAADVWAPLRPLIGEWQGTGDAGKSTIEARYEFTITMSWTASPATAGSWSLSPRRSRTRLRERVRDGSS